MPQHEQLDAEPEFPVASGSAARLGDARERKSPPLDCYR
jgi:hypothetical protein